MPHHRLLVFASTTVLLCLPALLAGQSRNRPKHGPWKQGYKIPDGWIVHKTKHYEVQSQAGREKAERLGRHMETMLRVYVKRFRPTKTLSSKRYTIKLLKNRAEFLRFGASPGAGAYYSSWDKEMVCYDTGKWLDEEKSAGPITGSGDQTRALARARAAEAIYKMDILGAASHEGWHQYFDWYVGSRVSLPSWINEGMGDYFYTARPIKVKGRKMPAKIGRMNPMRLSVIQWAVKHGKHVPIADILEYSQRDYYRNAGICYAEGWALCQFLLHGGNRRYAAVIPTFIRLVDTDTNMPAVTKKAFRGIDMQKLEADWKAWVLSQKLDEESAAKDPQRIQKPKRARKNRGL